MIKVPLRFSYISTFFVSNFYENRRTTRITCSTVSLRFFRADAFHCFFQRADGAENWEKGVDSGIVTLDGIWGDAAGEGEDGLAVIFLASLATAIGGFSHSSLSVETTLTGDDDIAVLDERFQRSFFQHDRGARIPGTAFI